MKRFAFLLALIFLLAPNLVHAAPLVAPCTETGPTAVECDPVSLTNPLPVSTVGYPIGSTAVNGVGTGTTGAVTGTLTGSANKTVYLCGFNVVAIGGTAPVGPITITGLNGTTQTYQGSASAAGGIVVSQTFSPCLPASVGTSVVVTTTADGTATAVDVNSWGYRQ